MCWLFVYHLGFVVVAAAHTYMVIIHHKKKNTQRYSKKYTPSVVWTTYVQTNDKIVLVNFKPGASKKKKRIHTGTGTIEQQYTDKSNTKRRGTDGDHGRKAESRATRRDRSPVLVQIEVLIFLFSAWRQTVIMSSMSHTTQNDSENHTTNSSSTMTMMTIL